MTAGDGRGWTPVATREIEENNCAPVAAQCSSESLTWLQVATPFCAGSPCVAEASHCSMSPTAAIDSIDRDDNKKAHTHHSLTSI